MWVLVIVDYNGFGVMRGELLRDIVVGLSTEGRMIIVDATSRCDESSLLVVSLNIKRGSIIIRGSIEIGFLTRERKLPIKRGWIPVGITRHDNVR